MSRFALVFLLTLVFSAAVPAAHAADFTFQVPVELHKIPADIKTFAVTVGAYDAPKDSRGAWGNRIGAGTSPGIPLVNGEYVGTVTVQFNADYRQKPEKAVAYHVELLLYGPPPHYQGGCLNSMMLDGPYPYDTTKPIACWGDGPIPPPAAAGSSQGKQAAPAVTPARPATPFKGQVRPPAPAPK